LTSLLICFVIYSSCLIFSQDGMALEHAILGFLDREPMTGYDLKTRCFDAAMGHLWTADQAQVYRTLDRLQSAKLVTSRLHPQRGKPDRKVYSVTAKGRAALAQWLAEPEPPPALRDPFLMHLFFSSDLSDSELLAQLGSARQVYQSRLDGLRSTATADLDEWESETGLSRDAALRRMTLTAGMASARTAIDWIDECTDRVRAGLPPAGSDTPIEGDAT
jgi:PadR family transcriptional regulator, regulatory protein AphA